MEFIHDQSHVWNHKWCSEWKHTWTHNRNRSFLLNSSQELFSFSFHRVCSMYFLSGNGTFFSFLFTFCFMGWIKVTDYFSQKINDTFDVKRWPPFWQEWLGTCAENKSPELLRLECPSSHSLTRAVAFETTHDRCSATFSVSGWVMPTAKAL